MRRVKTVLLVILVVGVATTLSAQNRRSVLIQAAQPYDALVSTIEQAGGTVTYRYKHVNGLAADLPESAVAQIERLVGPDNMGRDEIVPLPEVADPRGQPAAGTAEAEDVVTLDQPDGPVDPANYNFNATLTNVAPLHSAGQTGAGVIIAVIDSGYRPIKVHVDPSRIIAPGLSLVPGATEPPAISDLNEAHGTFVAGMAAANAAFCFSTANRFVVVAQHHGAAFPSAPCTATQRLVPMVGSAPGASIFPIKVFPAAGGGAPTSRIIAAMDAAIELRRKYDNGEVGGLNIRVANLSLGGPTNAAARELDDAAIEALINADIVPVVAAGNEGFSSVTTGSPSTSFAALTVGSASDHKHEQIFRSQFSVPCNAAPLATVLACAQAYRPDTNVQISTFSSRGPTHDGRTDPDVVAVGSYNYSQATGGATAVSFGSGTSFSTPTVSGIAAVLRQAVPSATARQVRRAIIESADASKVPTADANDQGAGFVNAAAALARLQAGDVADTYDTAGFTRNLEANMERAGHPVYGENPTSLHLQDVRPGEVTDIPFVVHENTQQLSVRIHSITPALPPGQQNQLFTDDVYFQIQSSIVHNDDIRAAGFLIAGQERLFTVTRPGAGIWRITPSGDWTNVGTVSYNVDIWTTSEAFPEHTAKATILDGESHVYTIDVPAGTTSLETRLEWMNMNGNYPISDVDVILTPPSGPVVNSCNTLRTPELCVVTNPVAGAWTARVVGFSVPEFGLPGRRETYTLRIEANNIVLKPR